MKRWKTSAIACALSLIAVTPLLAQAQSATQSSTPAATAPATTTPPPTATAPPPSACAGMTGAARTDCENSENASNALCFGMSPKVRADCEKSYYPNKQQAQPAKVDSGQSSSSGSASGAPK
jgi:hypothetical protein